MPTSRPRDVAAKWRSQRRARRRHLEPRRLREQRIARCARLLELHEHDAESIGREPRGFARERALARKVGERPVAVVAQVGEAPRIRVVQAEAQVRTVHVGVDHARGRSSAEHGDQADAQHFRQVGFRKLYLQARSGIRAYYLR